VTVSKYLQNGIHSDVGTNNGDEMQQIKKTRQTIS